MSHPTPSSSYEAVLFDLDGTLVDSRPGIEASAKAALAIVRPDATLPPLDGLLGLPLDRLVEALGSSLDADEREAVAAAFVGHYDTVGWLASDPYPGVREVLVSLRRIGARLFIVTNKRRVPATRLLEHHDLLALIEEVFALDSEFSPPRSKDAMGLACMHTFRLHPSTTLVVGDSEDDLAMARACNAGFAAASWGYGSAAALIADSVGQDFPVGDDHVPCRVILGTIVDLWELVAPGSGVQSDQ